MHSGRIGNMATEAPDALKPARIRKAFPTFLAQIDRAQPQAIPALPAVLLQVGIAAFEIRDAGEIVVPGFPAGRGNVSLKVVLNIVQAALSIKIQAGAELNGAAFARRRLEGVMEAEVQMGGCWVLGVERWVNGN